ncbi:MAG: hypothetical protein ABSH06_02860 [Thermodesulfobacteriota bacterium]
MTSIPFDTQLVLSGPFRRPRQMLEEQEIDGHLSIHNDATAKTLGFKAGPIEGPTHFSQFVPLLYKIWGQQWLETGCISAHYQNMCIEGDEVKAYAELPGQGNSQIRIWAEKKDGTLVLSGTASVGPEHPETALERRLRSLRAAGKLVILRDVKVGDKGAQAEKIKIDFDQRMGAKYPFSLNNKLKVITEMSPWYTEQGSVDSPWKRPIIPLEMVSVLTQYTSSQANFPVLGPAISLFVDQEIRMIKGPLFVGKEYLLNREIIALSESHRTESYWTKTHVRDPENGEIVAVTILNHAILKESFAGYKNEA